MNQLLILFALVLCFNFSYSQDNLAVYFKEAQPATITNESVFGEDLRGTYKKQNEDFVDIVIDEETIEVRYLVRMFLPTATIEEEDKYYFKSNKLFGVDSSQGLEYFIENDTVYFGILQIDELFNTKESVVKKIESQYVINTKLKEGVWETNLVYKKNDILYIRSIDVTKERKKITDNMGELNQSKLGKQAIYLMEPSTAKFNKFVDAKGFYDIVKYTKVH